MQSIQRRINAAVGIAEAEEQANGKSTSPSTNMMSSMGLGVDFAFSSSKSETAMYESESEEDDDDYLEEDLTGMLQASGKLYEYLSNASGTVVPTWFHWCIIASCFRPAELNAELGRYFAGLKPSSTAYDFYSPTLQTTSI